MSGAALVRHYQPLFCAAVIFGFAGWLPAQPTQSPDKLWRSLETSALRTAEAVVADGQAFKFVPLNATVFEIDPSVLTNLTSQAIAEGVARANTAAARERTITLPLPDGTFHAFELIDSPVMSPALQAKFPEIRSFRGRSLNDPLLTMRMDVSPSGLHAQVLGPDGTIVVDPTAAANQYQSYVKQQNRQQSELFRCDVDGRTQVAAARAASTVALASGSQLRTYRLAVACTGEYAQRFGGTVAGAMAAINTTVNRVVGIYERELAVRLVLVDDNDQLVFTNATSDPFNNTNANVLINQSQSVIDSRIGSANYDIGHTFSTGAGGLAGLGVVGVDGSKGRGVTGRADPVGDPFDVDYVAHEMGHQFGGDHTFNGTSGSCGGANRNAATAVEPGSGSTIQAYAGICGADDLQLNSNAYFHGISLDQILALTTLGSGNVGVVTNTGNAAPTVVAGLEVTIPKNTPFRLSAQGNDPDGDRLTYCWEQIDIGPAAAASKLDDGQIPLFRSFSPTVDNSRVFPKWSDILNNSRTSGEQLPQLARSMTFRVTVRDGRSGGGGINSATQTVKVHGAAGPFTVEQPTSNAIVGRLLEIQWNVAGTDASPVNCQKVNIRLSIDGGNTFTETLATSTANDGKETVALPATSSSNLRWLVEAADNAFFAVNKANVSITPANVEVYLSRHAERGPGNDPDLTAAGKLRAAKLAELMKRVGITKVFSTNTHRTQQTAAPSAAAVGVTIQPYDDVPALVTTLKALPAGEKVLVIGHSNSLGDLTSGLGVTQAVSIAETEFDKLLFVGLTSSAPQFSQLQLVMPEPAPTPTPAPASPVSLAARAEASQRPLVTVDKSPAAPRASMSARAADADKPAINANAGAIAESISESIAETVAVSAAAVEASSTWKTMQQNWSAAEAEEFYSLRQGSPLMRRPFFDALEQANSTQAFRSQDNLGRYGFLPRAASANNPEGYPIGFVGNEAIEMNCSACHTSRLNHRGVTYLVDGGQAMTDMENFQRDLAAAIAKTFADAPPVSSLPEAGRITLDLNTKFGRFARRLLTTATPAASQVRVVLTLLQQDYERRQTYNDLNDYGKRIGSDAERAAAARHVAYGFGRLDALGGILNQATAVALNVEENARSSDAPVNYPCIWDAPQHTHVQWNGAVDNTSALGPLGRNAGQVIGVFGIIKTDGTLVGYDSSINFDALKRAEELITKLWSPKWPAEFGLDTTLAQTGESIYQRNCITCHAIIKRDDPNRRVNDVLVSLDREHGPYGTLSTDDLVAKNWRDRMAKVGPLAGRNETIPLRGRFPNQPDSKVFARDILSHMVFNAISRSFVPWREELNIDDTAAARTFSEQIEISLMRYKSRSLNGVWSTSPYLHNGSVLDMVQLLTKPEERLSRFQVGTSEFDPKTLGFVNQGPFTFDTSLPGNSNAGHRYGTDLSDADKLALIEFLKTL